MKKIMKISWLLALSLLLAIGCSKSDSTTPGEPDNTDNPGDGGEDNGNTEATYSYALMTKSDALRGAGFLTTFNEMPSGDISALNNRTLDMNVPKGIRQYGDMLFSYTSPSGEDGIQKLTIDQDGNLQEAGFLDATNFYVVNETKGYYWDLGRGAMKIQIFNPTTMERTGEIDLSDLASSDAEYNSVGQNILAVKDGVLYADVTHTSNQVHGTADSDVTDDVEVAVIDVETNTLIKTIKYDGIGSLGFGSSANELWTLGDDGALYLFHLGLKTYPEFSVGTSHVLRIKKEETDFDRSWILSSEDFDNGTIFENAVVKDGKMYTQLASEPLASNGANAGGAIFDYYAIDLETKAATKIAGVPSSGVPDESNQFTTVIDGKVYLLSRNYTTGESAYYLLDEKNNKASLAFKLKEGGFLSGIVKLEK